MGEVVTFQRGFDLPKDKMRNGEYPVAGSNGVIGWHSEYTTKGPGVTIGRSGNIGTPHFYKSNYWAHNTSLFVKDFKGNDPLFIYYLLKRIDFKQLNTGSAVPTLNRNHVHDLQVLLPPIDEQKRIAGVLSSLDDKIDLLNRENATLEALAETLFRHYFIENPNPTWKEMPVSYYGKVICGKTPAKKNAEYYGGEVPFVKIPDMHGKTYVFNSDDTLTKEGQASQKEKTLPKESIMVSCIATVGLVSMNANEVQTNQQINSVVPYYEHYRYYLYCWFKSMYDELNTMASGGTATLNLNTGDFSRIGIPMPDEAKIKEFHLLVEPLFAKTKSNQQQMQTLAIQRDTLLPRLMSSEVKVNNKLHINTLV